jgi:hypothetical protein
MYGRERVFPSGSGYSSAEEKFQLRETEIIAGNDEINVMKRFIVCTLH